MKYLKIQNIGELDIRLIALMGGSTKTDDASKIGQFGTGLKYAISYLVRSGIDFKLFIGENEVTFSTKDENISGKHFKEIYCNGKSMNITTHYGYQWKAWEAVREIWCNATDEGCELKKVVDGRTPLIGTAGSTTFFIQLAQPINEVLTKWETYFFQQEPLFENDTVAIYKNTENNLKLYKNGVLIQDSEYYKSLFVYDLKQANLNELRQYQGYLSYDIANALLSSTKEVITTLLTAMSDIKNNALYEIALDWEYKNFTPEHVKQIFSGWRFLHPKSSGKTIGKSIVVKETLFDLLKSCGLPTERINKTSGGYYGGGGVGYKQGNDITYKEVRNPELQQRIQAIATKYGSSMRYSIAVPNEIDFELLVTNSSVIYNSSLENLSPADLEATVLIGIFHSQEHDVFKAFKRLIRFVMGNRNFRKILFGRNISDKSKPTYIEPPIEKIIIPTLVEDVIF